MIDHLLPVELFDRLSTSQRQRVAEAIKAMPANTDLTEIDWEVIVTTIIEQGSATDRLLAWAEHRTIAECELLLAYMRANADYANNRIVLDPVRLQEAMPKVDLRGLFR